MRDTDFVDIKPLKDFREHDNHMLNIVIEMEKFNAWRYAFFCQCCFSYWCYCYYTILVYISKLVGRGGSLDVDPSRGHNLMQWDNSCEREDVRRPEAHSLHWYLLVSTSGKCGIIRKCGPALMTGVHFVTPSHHRVDVNARNIRNFAFLKIYSQENIYKT